MEKYVKLRHVNNLLVKMHKEPRYQHEGEDYHSGVAQVAVMLIDVPTVEFEEPKVGKWYFGDDGKAHCSECDMPGMAYAWKYCPNCGAAMELASNNDRKTAKWEFWEGWVGNHDMRIEDATCSNCGYVHPTVRRELIGNKFKSGETPQDILNKLSDTCLRCGARMSKE
jgi:ribosomal protein S27AE